MHNNKKKKLLFSTKKLVFMAVMIALSIILGKFLAINVTTMIRISLENLPIILTAVTLGPLAGGMVAFVSDIIGCVIRGYEINPIVTFGAIAIGVICGLIAKQRTISKKWVVKLVIAVYVAHFFGSVLIKTLGVSAFYLSNYNMGFVPLFFIRFGVYIVTAAIEIGIILLLMKNKSLRSQLLNVKREKKNEL